ncbi:MAG: hypothetical protein ACI9HB_003002 [Gammaproteobacteria bacterium]
MSASVPSGLNLPPNFCAMFYRPPSQPVVTPNINTISAA